MPSQDETTREKRFCVRCLRNLKSFFLNFTQPMRGKFPSKYVVRWKLRRNCQEKTKNIKKHYWPNYAFSCLWVMILNVSAWNDMARPRIPTMWVESSGSSFEWQNRETGWTWMNQDDQEDLPVSPWSPHIYPIHLAGWELTGSEGCFTWAPALAFLHLLALKCVRLT